MKTAKTSKRALLCSVLSIALCLSMLIGTTFAWFTDTATTAVNKIQAGNLDVDIIGATTTGHVDQLNFTKAAGAADGEQLLWEPGCRYLTEGFRIANNGNLALKWKAEINKDKVVNGKVDGSTIAKDGKSLLDVIDFYVVTSTAENAEAVAIEDFIGKLAKTEKSGVYYIKGVMQTTAGNDYQDLTLEGITITVYATQDTVEYDSTGNTYDAKAAYPATTANELQDALTKGGVINVTENLDPEATLTVSGDTKATIDATGKTIANQKDLWDDSTNAWSLISVQEQANLTITGGNFQAKANDCYAIDVQDPGAKLTIKDGNFNGNISAVYVYEGEVTIEGGFFQIQQLASNEGRPYSFLLNCYDANFKNGSAKITVTGGTFVNFNPANTNGEPVNPTSYLPAGYHVVEDVKSATETWYTVVAD